MKPLLTALSASISAACLLVCVPAKAATPADGAPPVSLENTERAASAAQYWTPERFKAAKPLPLPSVSPDAVREEALPAAPPPAPESSDGRAPPSRVKVTPKQLYAPAPTGRRQSALLDVEPQATGTFNTPFTSTRVFPLFGGASAPLSADRAYPYITVGKLFFSINGSPFVCSASVIQRRVVATAGHCVHSGTAAGFHSNWVFVPAFRDGVAPFKQWFWRYVITTGTWAGGGGGVPNAADYAMIEFADQSLTTGGPVVKLGNVTGWLGWQTLSLANNHTSKLGYPCNLDSCQKMQNVTSTSFRTTSPNNVEYGSDARGGSSGGPWVQNFATLAVGGGTGSNTGQNRVVGVTSYGYISTDPKVEGASILDSRWVDIWNTICARPGNCI
jgi:V8-like Glu-specific endopeptidase